MSSVGKHFFTRQHYNAIEKDIREEFPIDLMPNDVRYNEERRENMIRRTAITQLALRLAYRFYEDNDRFDPLRFLDACSPQPELYPLSELWEDYAKSR